MKEEVHRVAGERLRFGEVPLPHYSHAKNGVSSSDFAQENYSEVKGV